MHLTKRSWRVMLIRDKNYQNLHPLGEAEYGDLPITHKQAQIFQTIHFENTK